MTTKPEPRTWCVEDAKNVRLFVQDVTETEVRMSYHPDTPIAVTATLDDFAIFFFFFFFFFAPEATR